MNKFIFRLSLLIVGLLMGASDASGQVKTIADFPDSTIARYASLESRGFEVIPSNVTYKVGNRFMVGIQELEESLYYKKDTISGCRTLYGLYDKKKNSKVEYALDLVDFMKWRDSLKVENQISRFLSDIRYAKEFKKFLKMVKKKFGYRGVSDVTADDLVQYVTLSNGKMVGLDYILNKYNIELFCRKEKFIESFKRDNTCTMDIKKDVVEQYVTLDDGKLNFPGCDEKVVKTYLAKYGLNYNSFELYLTIKAWEKFYLNPFLLENCGFIKVGGRNISIRSFSYAEYDYKDPKKHGEFYYNRFDVDGIDVREKKGEIRASIDGDTFSKTFLVGYQKKYRNKYGTVEWGDYVDVLRYSWSSYADIDFRKFLVRHFPTREEILSWKKYDYFISVSKDGHDAVAYHKYRGNDINFGSGPYFQKRWDGRWTYGLKNNVIIVLDSTTMLAMLPFVELHEWQGGRYLANMFDYLEETPEINVTFEDTQLGVKFEPAFQAGLWVESSATPKYSWKGISLQLDNYASIKNVLYDKSHSYKLALGLDKSAPNLPQAVRNGISSQKADDLKKAYEKRRTAEIHRKVAEGRANFIKEKSKIYGLKQVQTYVNNGYKPFIGMSWKLFRNEYMNGFTIIERSDSYGNYIVREVPDRWYYFYNNRLDHWVDY